jgi:transcriptional/translational regulatory protein YebC/TACO1
MLVSNAKLKVERKASRPVKAGEPDSDVGQALRTVYERAIEEDIPQEMLDLLGKLK